MRGFFMAEKTKKLPDSRKQRHAALPAGNFGQIMRFFYAPAEQPRRALRQKKRFAGKKKAYPKVRFFIDFNKNYAQIKVKFWSMSWFRLW